MAQPHFQQVNVEWSFNPIINKVMDAGNMSRAQAAWHVAMLCTVLMDDARDGDISKLDKDWICDRCSWEGETHEFFKILRDAGVVSFDLRGRPSRIIPVRELIGKRLDAWQAEKDRKQAKRDADKSNANDQTDRESDPHTSSSTSEGREDTTEYRGRPPDVRRTSEGCPPDNRKVRVDKLQQHLQSMGANFDVAKLLDEGFQGGVLKWACDQCARGKEFDHDHFNRLITDLRIYKRFTVQAVKREYITGSYELTRFAKWYNQYNIDSRTWKL